MDEDREFYRAWKQHSREASKERRHRNLENAWAEGTDGWTVHREDHWSRSFLGHKLDYWPTRNKWRWRNRTYTGGIKGWMKKLERQHAEYFGNRTDGDSAAGGVSSTESGEPGPDCPF